jgi:hypothetical protein
VSVDYWDFVNIVSQGIFSLDATFLMEFTMTQDDNWSHVHIKLDPEMKDSWEDYVDETEGTATLSALIRKSVQKEITGEYEVTEEKYEEVYEELANLTTTVGSINSNLEALRKENVDSGEFEDGLDTVIDRMEDLHGRKGGTNE